MIYKFNKSDSNFINERSSRAFMSIFAFVLLQVLTSWSLTLIMSVHIYSG
jgi:hypothetical protein